MKLKALVGSVVIAFTLAACGAGPSEQEVRTKAAALTTDGEISSSKKQVGGEGEEEWQVMLAMKGGGEVEAVYSPETGELVELKSEQGPFDYELAPGNGFIAYSAAKAKALQTKAGAVEAWEFESGKNQWEFYVRDANQQLWEIKMKATDGTVTSTEAKAARD